MDSSSVAAASTARDPEDEPLFSPDVPPEIRYRRGMRLLSMANFAAWLFTASVGCYGFYVGWNTDSHDFGDKVCGFSRDECVVVASHKTLCAACHQTTTDYTMILISFYQVLFGMLGILAECRSILALRQFRFTSSRFGRGVLSLLVGTVAISEGLAFSYAESWTFASGVLSTLVGVFSILSYCFVPSRGSSRPFDEFDEVLRARDRRADVDATDAEFWR